MGLLRIFIELILPSEL